MIQIFTLVFTFLITLNSQSLDDQSLVQTCIYLSRYYARENQQEIIDVIQSYSNQDDQKSIWSKLYIGMVSKCSKTMTFQQSYQIFEDMKNQKFQFEDFRWHFTDIQLQDYKWGKISLQLSELEKAIGQTIESFEKSLQEHQEQMNKQEGGQQNSDQSVEQEIQDYDFQLNEIFVLGSIMFVLVIFIYIGCCTKSNTNDSNKTEKKQKKVSFKKTDEKQEQQKKVNFKKTDDKQD